MSPIKIVSLQNPLAKHLVRIRQDRDYRTEQQSVLVTGRKLIEELSQVVKPKKLFLTDTSERISSVPTEVFQVSEEVLKKITGLPNPEGLAAEFPLPNPTPLDKAKMIVIFDGLADPGNMGTLIRTALALGWGGIFFLPHCVDPFHEKVLRASKGALFHLFFEIGDWERLRQLRADRHAYVADLEGTPLSAITPRENVLLLLSNESQGVSPEGNRFGEKLSIPISGKMESLNVAVAGGILMYHLKKHG